MSVKNNNIEKSKNSDAIAILKEHIKTKNPARVYLFYGNEPFLIDYYTGELKRLITGNDTQGLNLVKFEDKVDVGRIIDACDTFPVFSDKKLVIVKNSSLFINKGKKSVSAEDGTNDGEKDDPDSIDSSEAGNKAQETLKQYIPLIPETTCLIFIEDQADKRLGLYKQIGKYGLAAELNRLGPQELINWVTKGFRTLGKSIEAEAAQYLVAISEPDMYSLKNEILKISSYAGKRKEITLEDIKLMAAPTIKSVIFDLLDAVARKNAPGALHLLDDMLTLKEPEQKILAMLSKQTGEILKLKYLLKKGASQQQITRYFQGKHPYALRIMMEQAQLMDEKYLKEFLKNCMETETSYKKGLIGVRLSLEVLLTKINNA